jgi:hypothetical protein
MYAALCACENFLEKDGATVLLVSGARLHGGRIAEAAEVGQVVLLIVIGVFELNLLQVKTG